MMAVAPSVVAVTPAVVAPSVVTVAPSAMRAHIADGVGLSRHWLGGRGRGHHEGRRDDHGRGRESNREFSHRVLLSLRHKSLRQETTAKSRASFLHTALYSQELIAGIKDMEDLSLS
jgi:hypothetical protein